MADPGTFYPRRRVAEDRDRLIEEIIDLRTALAGAVRLVATDPRFKGDDPESCRVRTKVKLWRALVAEGGRR